VHAHSIPLCKHTYTPLYTEVASKLFSACSSGDAEAVRNLLKTEPYTNTLMDMQTAGIQRIQTQGRLLRRRIYAAALKGHYDVVKVLLKGKANANASTGLGTPIYAAVSVEVWIWYGFSLNMVPTTGQ